jgi:hypothetical protein
LREFFKKLYGYWLIFGNFLGTINAYIIMTLIFFLLIGPISLFLRVFRIDVLGRRQPESSNWHAVMQTGDDIESYKRLS